MEKRRYSAEQLCSMYPEKYIAVNHLNKDKDGIIVGAEIIRVYDSLEDCKKNMNEIKFFKNLYQDDYDILYGDFEDYVETRTNNGIIEIPFDEFATVDVDGTIVIDAVKAFGAIAILGANEAGVVNILASLSEDENSRKV